MVDEVIRQVSFYGIFLFEITMIPYYFVESAYYRAEKNK